jgi:hypothetical protein
MKQLCQIDDALEHCSKTMTARSITPGFVEGVASEVFRIWKFKIIIGTYVQLNPHPICKQTLTKLQRQITYHTLVISS